MMKFFKRLCCCFGFKKSKPELELENVFYDDLNDDLNDNLPLVHLDSNSDKFQSISLSN